MLGFPVPDIIACALEFIYTGHYDAFLHIPVTIEDALKSDIRMYEFAHTEEIWDLKEVARNQILAAATKPLPVSDYKEIAQHVFQSPQPFAIKGELKELVVDVGARHARSLYTSPDS